MVLCIIFLSIYTYDRLLLNAIPARQDNKSIRIGYINLHASRVDRNDLKRLAQYKCDLWLFLEWNGNNLELDTNFLAGYTKNFELIDEKTFGAAVFSRWKDAVVSEIGSADRPYTCDYRNSC